MYIRLEFSELTFFFLLFSRLHHWRLTSIGYFSAMTVSSFQFLAFSRFFLLRWVGHIGMFRSFVYDPDRTFYGHLLYGKVLSLPTLRSTSSLEVCIVHGILRILRNDHNSKASNLLIVNTLRIHVSDPYERVNQSAF